MIPTGRQAHVGIVSQFNTTGVAPLVLQRLRCLSRDPIETCGMYSSPLLTPASMQTILPFRDRSTRDSSKNQEKSSIKEPGEIVRCKSLSSSPEAVDACKATNAAGGTKYKRPQMSNPGLPSPTSERVSSSSSLKSQKSSSGTCEMLHLRPHFALPSFTEAFVGVSQLHFFDGIAIFVIPGVCRHHHNQE